MTFEERRRLEREYQRALLSVRRTMLMLLLALASALLLSVEVPSHRSTSVPLITSALAP